MRYEPIRGEKVKNLIKQILLLIVIMPILVSCNIQPEDKWPVITDWKCTGDLDVVFFTSDSIGIPQVSIANPRISVEVKVRTYNVNQDFTAKIVLERLRWEFFEIHPETGDILSFEEDYPFDSMAMTFDNPIDDPHGDPTEIIEIKGIKGTYVANSGQPPWGETRLSFFFEPVWRPTLPIDWVGIDTKTQLQYTTLRYVFLFKVIIQDAGGRTDSFKFQMTSNAP